MFRQSLRLRTLKKFIVPQYFSNNFYRGVTSLKVLNILNNNTERERDLVISPITLNRLFSEGARSLSPAEFEAVCKETLDSLAEYFDEIIETVPIFKKGDITYSDGVITAFLGENFGTYVINRQTPNQQIWLSSPSSGPKRYDFINGEWLYKHDNVSLHTLLDTEFSAIFKKPFAFSSCSYANKQ